MSRIPNNRPHPPKGAPPKSEKPPKEKNRKKGLGPGKKGSIIAALCAPTRKQFKEEYPVCMMCQTQPSQDAHEITRGIGREYALANPRLLLSVCRECHERLDNADEWPIHRQLYVRLLRELDRMVHDANESMGWAQTAITVEEVLDYTK